MPESTFTRVPPGERRAPARAAPAPGTAPPPRQAPAPSPEPEAGAAAVLVRGLRRSYGPKLALDGASFEVARGEVFGFLGPNGAGKTTLIRVLVGLLRADAGEAFVLGARAGPSATEAKALVGYVPEEPSLPGTFRALDLLVAYGRFHGLARAASEARGRELLGLVGLGAQHGARLRTFSHGMRKRFALAQALLHDPPVLVLDEPTSGLDPAGTAWFRDLVRALRGQGKTVFLSSHLLHEVEQVCDRVAIIHRGRVLAVDRIAALGERLRARTEILVVAEGLGAEGVEAVRALPGVAAVAQDGARLRVEASGPGVAPQVNAALVASGARVAHLEVQQPSLEEIFLALTEAGP